MHISNFVSAAHLEMVYTCHPGKALKERSGLLILMLFVIIYFVDLLGTNDDPVSQMDVIYKGITIKKNFFEGEVYFFSKDICLLLDVMCHAVIYFRLKQLV